VRNGIVEGKNCTELKWGGTSPFIVVSGKLLRKFSKNIDFEKISFVVLNSEPNW
jgi:hypothetical protein